MEEKNFFNEDLLLRLLFATAFIISNLIWTFNFRCFLKNASLFTAKSNFLLKHYCENLVFSICLVFWKGMILVFCKNSAVAVKQFSK